MIELIAAAVSGAVVGGGVVSWIASRRIEKITAVQASDRKILWAVGDTLTALRSNCFITNEKGHRVRYSQASAQRRVKAETPKGVV